MLKSITRKLAKPYKRLSPINKRVVILIPMGSNPGLTELEMVSIRQLDHFLPGYDRFFITPEGKPFTIDGYGCKEYPGKYFGSVAAHARMLLNPNFFTAFHEYDYIFFYHTDAIVLSADLETWMDKGYDYIGPPWIISEKTPWVKKQRVGNCGFALLRVEATEKALRNRYRAKPQLYWTDKIIRNGKKLGFLISLLRSLGKFFPNSYMINEPVKRWDHSETDKNNCDLFYSDEAVKFNPDYKVAPFEEGLKFGFEVDPYRCYEMNNQQLPFGAHAWYKFEKEFWDPHLLQENLSSPTTHS